MVVSIGYGGLAALDSHALRDPELRREATALARELGAEGTPVGVQEVHDLTTQANAVAVGLGPTERILLWDTLLDGRFSDGEVEFVLAHEFGHIVRGHLWKGILWFLLFAVPGLAIAGLDHREARRPAATLASCRTECSCSWSFSWCSRRSRTSSPGTSSPRRTGSRSRRPVTRPAGRGLFEEFSRDEPRATGSADLGVPVPGHASDDHAAHRDDRGVARAEPAAGPATGSSGG